MRAVDQRVLLVAGCLALMPPPLRGAERAVATRFTAEAFISHVRYLASDALAGRGLGSKGIDQAATYIARQFETAGVQPGGDDGGFFQSFELTIRREVTAEVRLVIGGTVLKPGKDFVTTHLSGGGTFEGPVAFVGYGITAPDHDYDDYARFDAHGKVLLMLRYEPHDDDPDAKFGGRTHSKHAFFSTKLPLAKQHGAVAVLLVNPPQHHGKKDELLLFDESVRKPNLGLPFLHVTRAVADKLLKAGGLADLKTLQGRLDTDRKSLSADLAGMTAKGNTGLKSVKGTGRNVVGMVRAGGDKADEFLVIGAHYDHLGFARSPFKRGDPNKYIHNGADDNASGVAGLIELARRLAAEAATLRRSVVLIAFTGEESGLLGSNYYVKHPTVPLARVVAMLNMDMIGRLRHKKVQVFGVKTAKPFAQMLTGLTEAMGLKLSTRGAGTGPSDQTSFYNQKIPVLHFFTGTHRDYHRPSDDTDRINAEGGALVTELVYRVARQLINRDERLAFHATKAERSSRPHLKVRLGLMPSYIDDDEKGMAIDGVSPESPAERAGLKAGDRLLRLGGQPVDSVYDLMDAMTKLKPDHQTPIVVRRKGKDLELSITPEGRS